MSKLRHICAISALSASIGSFFGSHYEKSHWTTNTPSKETSKWDNLLSKIFPFSKVFASAKNHAASQPMDVDNYQPKQVISSNRPSEIMRFGFPSLDNVLTYDDHILAYDRRNKVPHWVFEHLTADRVKYTEGVNRSNCDFLEDDAIHHYFRATNRDYFKSGFDRGHLAAAGNHRSSQRSCEQTFFLSNIAPQVGDGFNRHAWNDLEKYTRSLTKSFKNVYVCTGPLYLPMRDGHDGKLYVKYQVIGRNQVAVPTHFFKVIICESSANDLHLLSYVLPNQRLPENVNLNHYLVPLESVERASGLLIFDKLSKNRLKTANGRNIY